MVTTGCARPLRVLILDDEEDTTTTQAVLLRAWGHKVAVANDGPAALELARTQEFDVFLVDIGLPGMNGFEFIKALAGQSDPDRPPHCIAITGYGAADMVER